MSTSPICTWPFRTAGRICGWGKREPPGWTVILTLPPVASSTSLTNCRMFWVWKFPGG